VLVDLNKAEPDRLVAGDGVVLHPVAAGVLVEIDAGVNGLIDIGDIEFGRRMLRGGAGCRGNRFGVAGFVAGLASGFCAVWPSAAEAASSRIALRDSRRFDRNLFIRESSPPVENRSLYKTA
jgi:hypothetical protein